MSDRTRQKAGIIMEGVTEKGVRVPLLVDEDGALQTSGSGGGGGGGGGGGTSQTLEGPTSYTDDQAVSSGASSIGFVPSTDFVGTVNGNDWPTDLLPKGATITAPSGSTLPAVPFTCTAGSYVLFVMRAAA